VVAPPPSPSPAAALAITATPSLAPIEDFTRPARSFAPRPVPVLPNAARVVLVVPKVVWRFRSTGNHASGTATWYCQPGVSACHSAYPGGMYAAAGPALRVGAWRGRIVQVCGNGRCVRVKLIDWCACGGSHIIDLYSDAFRQLAPLNAGGLRVTVSW
jgi:rare lipoprotein A (peptidoglycan hydrolase)